MSEFKIGDEVVDQKYPENGIGVVIDTSGIPDHLSIKVKFLTWEYWEFATEFKHTLPASTLGTNTDGSTFNGINSTIRETNRVNHPDHYGGDTTYEAIKVIEAWDLGFSLGNAVKYISRAGKKDSDKEIEDLHKAQWYLERHLDRIK